MNPDDQKKVMQFMANRAAQLQRLTQERLASM